MSAADSECDVLVVGAGPGGTAAAFALAQRGWQVILTERQRYPADKLCGEFLSADGVEVLDRLGMWPDSGPGQFPRIGEISLSATDGSFWSSELPDAGVGCSRLRLDHMLMDACRKIGVQVVEGVRVRRVDGDFEGGFVAQASAGEVEHCLRSRLVVAAYGKHGRLRGEGLSHDHDRRIPHENQLMALKVHIEADGGALRQLAGKVELHGFPGGYAGLSEVEGSRINLCLLTQVSRFKEADFDCERFSAQWMMNNPALAGRLEMLRPRWAGRLAQANLSFGSPRRPRQGLLYLGDSAGSITPLCGDGMSMALRSAELISAEADRFLQGTRTGSRLLQDSERLWRSEFRRRIRLGQLLQWALQGGGRRAASVIRLLQSSPALGQWLIRQTRGSVRSSSGVSSRSRQP